MASLEVEPKKRNQEQGDSLDSGLSPNDTPSGLKISATFPPKYVKGDNNKKEANFWQRKRSYQRRRTECWKRKISSAQR